MRLGRLLAVPLILVTPLALAACGESSQEKARKQVCAASSEISKQLTKLEGLPINTSFPTEAVTSLEAIAKSLKEVKSAAPNLEPARKEEVEAGTKAFLTQIGTITATLAATAIKSGDTEAALKAAEPKIKAAENQLTADYKQAFAALKCS
ncbi:MAG TPA: hypothetical protein VK721_13910 [Solirubrobacteraceae bacterium]|nr:hypothetical protein [Solirubrobacteraceae bacterium]